MLHRSFKPAKCKTALKLAVSRIKLLKNKKEAAYKQQKREVAQLLESGQDRTARIRVEHVVREEKTMAAYELIEIYCELIVARLSMIESQKNCPIDMKEAITSVVFASPRCADIPELLDISKHFTAKYGKDFISSAVELRPNSGVNRMLVEKLSAVAPDIQTKIKILSTIAEEHNIKWDPFSLGEMDGKPTDDLLSGPKTFEHANKIDVEPPVVQALLRHEQKHDVPVTFSQQSTLRSENFSSTDVGASKKAPASLPPEPRPTRQSEDVERRHSFSRDENDFPLDKQNWNMEFKDATSAAQAAAEAAERASMAARAAAELSSRENTKFSYSKGSQNSSVYGLRNEGRQNHVESTLLSEDPVINSGNNSFHGTNSTLQNEQDDRNEEDNPDRETQQLYSRSRKSIHPASPPDDILVKSPPKNDDYSQMSSSRVGSAKRNSGDHFGEEFMKEQFNEKSEKHGIKTGIFDPLGEERIQKQSSRASSRSHSSTSSNDHEKFENDFGHDLLSSVCQENILKDTKQAPSYDHADLVFDDYGLKDGGHRFNAESAVFPSPGSKSQTRLTGNTNIFNSVSQSHLFTDPLDDSVGMSKSKLFSEPDDLPVTFDHSDGPSSESEEEQVKSKHGFSPTKQISPRLTKSQLDFDDINKYSLYNEFDEERSYRSSNLSSVYETKNSDQISETSNDTEDGEFLKLPSFNDGNVLNLGVLVGGRRNKVYKPPPYTSRHQSSDASSSFKPGVEEQSNRKLNTRDTNTSSDSESDDFIQEHRNQKEATKLRSKTRFENQSVQFDSDTSDLKVDLAQQNSPRKGRLASGGVSQRTRSGPSSLGDKSSYTKLKDSADGSVISGSDKEKTRLNERESSKLVQYKNRLHEERLKTSAFEKPRWDERTSSKPDDELKNTFQEEKLKISAFEKSRWNQPSSSKPAEEYKNSLKEERLKASSFEKPKSNELRPKPVPELKNLLPEERLKTSSFEKPRSDAEELKMPEERLKKSAFEKPRYIEQASPKPTHELKNSSQEERLKTSAFEKPSPPTSKTESLKPSSSTSADKIPPRENSIKKASHVHPKLPDFDSITAHMQSLRSNQK